MKQEKYLRTVGATIVLLGVLAAVVIQANNGSEPPSISIVTNDASGDTGEGQAEPQRDQEPFVYRVGVLAGITANNFWDFYGREPSVWNSYILGPTKPTLYALDESGAVTPELATEVVAPTQQDGTWQVEVTLRDDMAWSDGTSITAHDFVFTYETVTELKLGGSWADGFPEAIESVEAPSEHQLLIEFGARPNLAVWPHGSGLVPLMPAHVWLPHSRGSTADDLYAIENVEDVGGGPLTVVSVSTRRVVAIANPGYTAATAPDTVEYVVFDGIDQAADALVEGDVDTILTPNGLTDDQVSRFDKDLGIEVTASPGNGIRYLGFNLDRDPMSGLEFRQAIALLVDREGLAQAIAPNGQATYAFVNEANAVWYDPESADGNASRFGGPLPERLDAALEGLRSAGYTWTTEPRIGADGSVVAGSGLTIDGETPAPLTILTTGNSHDPWRPEYAASIAKIVGWLGFEAHSLETDFDTVVDLAFTPGADGALGYDMYLLGWTLGNPSLPGYYRTLFAADGEMNNTGYASPEFDALLDDFESSFAVEDAREALWRMETELAADLPYLLLYSSSITEAYRSDRITFTTTPGLGGLQAVSGAITAVTPVAG